MHPKMFDVHIKWSKVCIFKNEHFNNWANYVYYFFENGAKDVDDDFL